MILSCGDEQHEVTPEEMRAYAADVSAYHPTESVLALPYWLQYDAVTSTFYYGRPGAMPTAEAVKYWTQYVQSQLAVAVLPYFVRAIRHYT